MELTSVELPAENTAAAGVSFSSAFYNCKKLASADISGFTNINNMGDAFYYCRELTSVELPAENTAAAEVSFYRTFYDCKKLVSANISGFTNISSMSDTFDSCEQLASCLLPESNTAASALYLGSTFYNCKSLEFVDLRGFSVSNFSSTFRNCISLTSVLLGSVPASGYSGAFQDTNPACIKYIVQEGFDNTGRNWTNVVLPFAAGGTGTLNMEEASFVTLLGSWNNDALAGLCTTLQDLEEKNTLLEADLSGLAFEAGITTGLEQMFKDFESLARVTFPTDEYAGPVSLSGAFAGCATLENINLGMFTAIGDLKETFQGCGTLTHVLLGSAPAGDSEDAFAGANANCLKYIDAASFDNTDNWANVILATGEDGSWQAMDDMELYGTAPFRAPEAFAVGDDKTISYTLNIANCKTTNNEGEVAPAWATICLPFDANVLHPDKAEPTYLRTFDGEKGDYWLRAYSASETGVVNFDHANNGDEEDYADIKANVPYIISFPGAGWGANSISGTEVTFVATETGIAITPEEGIAEEKDKYHFRSDFRPMASAAADAYYVLGGTPETQMFQKNSGLPLGTFEVYFVDAPASPVGGMSLSIGGDNTGGTLTGLKPGTPQGAPPSEGWGVVEVVAGKGYLRIECDQVQQVVLYTATGMAVRMIVLNEGTNYVNGLQPGIYIIGGKKAMVL